MTNPTARPTASYLEERLGTPTWVHGVGFVRVIDYMGDDSSVVRAARQSYGDTQPVRGAAPLINYLMRHRHTSPFEACEIAFQIRAPIFVARQWMRHRTGSFNEESARYTELDHGYYLPAQGNMRLQSSSNKQGSEGVMPTKDAEHVQVRLDDAMKLAVNTYQMALRHGLAREQTRIVLPVASYTTFSWKIDLHNLFHFLNLRLAPDAQKETRAYAEVIEQIVAEWVPLSHAAWIEHQRDARLLSATMREVLSRMLKGERLTQETSGMTVREWAEMQEAIGYE